MLWACGFAGVVGLVLGLRFRVLVVIVLTWVIILLGTGMSLAAGAAVHPGLVGGLAAIVTLHVGYFVSSVARWAWTRHHARAGSRALRWKWRRSATL